MILLPLNEGIITALVAKLRAGLPEAIDAINAETADDAPLAPVPDAQVLDYIPVPATLTAFPTIAVGDGGSRFTADRGWSAEGEHELVVIVYVQEADQRRLALRLRRYVRAALSVALDQRDVGPAYGVRLVAIKPGPTLGREENPRDWMSYVGAVLAFSQDED